MTIYRVFATGGNDADDGSTWDLAKATLGAAVTAATGDGDIIYVHVAHAEALGLDTTYTFANNVRVICVDKDNSDALAVQNGTTQYIGHTSQNRTIALFGAYNLYFYGIAFLVTGSDQLKLANTDGASRVFENCYLSGGSTNGGLWVGDIDCQCSVTVIGGSIGSGAGGTTGYIDIRGSLEVYGATIFGASTLGSLVRTNQIDPAGATALFDGCDLSALGSIPIVGDCSTSALRVTVVNSKLGASFVALAAQTLTNKSSGEVWLYNCYSGDEHVHLQHHNALGATICDTSIYATSNICDSNLSWKIVGTANATFYEPYKSPWIDVYHTGTSAITPSLECVRSGSATAYNNDTLWSEWSYQGTSGFPKAVHVNSDRMTPLGSAAAQTTGALGAGDWTGENATSWFGKLAPAASFTPAEVGHIRARVCVAGANTIYVDPQIRGLS